MYAAGVDWHLFPNQVMLMGPTGLLGYRARPLGTNPDKCIWDVYSLQRYPAGEAPKVEQEWSQDHGDVDFWGLILTQAYQNLEEVQKGHGKRTCLNYSHYGASHLPYPPLQTNKNEI